VGDPDHVAAGGIFVASDAGCSVRLRCEVIADESLECSAVFRGAVQLCASAAEIGMPHHEDSVSLNPESCLGFWMAAKRRFQRDGDAVQPGSRSGDARPSVFHQHSCGTSFERSAVEHQR